MKSKWTSRKFWIGLIGMVSGIVSSTMGLAQSEQFSIIAGAVVAILFGLGYLRAESAVDVARASNKK